MTFCVVDVETTGLAARRDRITEIAAVRIENLSISHRQFASLVNPGCPIPPLITELTGIDNFMVRTAPTFRDIATGLSTHLDGAVMVAHNASFDMAFLREEYARLDAIFAPPHILDTVSLARRVLPGLSQYKLTSLCQHLHIKPGMHRAEGDALATAELFLHLARLAPSTLTKKLRIPERASC
ncbi:MAG TPA: exonuclease domain-containing protein [Bacillota bacterium]|nr:exonuclease domain-containing protein [Bacillota bacterium]